MKGISEAGWYTPSISTPTEKPGASRIRHAVCRKRGKPLHFIFDIRITSVRCQKAEKG